MLSRPTGRVRIPLILTLVLALLGGVGSVGAARAAITVSVAPSLAELEAAPGDTGELELTVFNDGDEPFSVTAVAQDHPQATPDRSARSWLQVTPAAFDLQPGQRQNVRVGIQVPAGLGSGGRYAVLGLRTGAKSAGGAGAGVSGEVGVPLLFTIKGDEPPVRQATVRRILPRLLPDGRVGFQVVLANEGNVHVFSRGTLELRDQDGALLQTFEVPESPAVTAGTERVLDASGGLALGPGRYTARARLAYGGETPAAADLTFSPSARLAVEELSAADQSDKGPTLRLVLVNQGELVVVPQVRLEVLGPGGASLGSAAPERPTSIAPSQRGEIITRYPGTLSPGDYILRARVAYGAGQLLEQQASFRSGAGPAANPAWDTAPGARTPTSGASAMGAPGWWLLGITMGALLLLGAALRWLPALAPFRRRVARAAQAFRGLE